MINDLEITNDWQLARGKLSMEVMATVIYQTHNICCRTYIFWHLFNLVFGHNAQTQEHTQRALIIMAYVQPVTL